MREFGSEPPLSIDEALRRILTNTPTLPVRRVPTTEAVGCRLAEAIQSDIDSPPYDKSTVDGFALRSADIAAGRREFTVVEQVAAGDLPRHAIASGMASRIMTGAPLPDGADAVVMVEHTTAGDWRDTPTVTIGERPVRAGQNILRRAQSLAQGQIVLPAGRLIRPIEVGVMSEVGATEALVERRPLVAVLATGNELVPADESPLGAQIRNSNGPMLRALAAQAGAMPLDLGIARDDEDNLRRHIASGLDADLLVLSGGVSAGVLDLAPRLLEELGFEPIFHKVHLRPGKPLWFGVRREGGATTLAFGLPGNPVSGLVCWELFVRPALHQLRTGSPFVAPEFSARLAAAHEQRGDRPTYWPAKVEASVHNDMSTTPAAEGTALPAVRLLAWQGSGDLKTLADANALAILPAGDRRWDAGEPIRVRPL